MLKRTKMVESLETVERERERATLSEVGFICDAKTN